jgi:uncharacterized peroxidase-related enzyme
MPRIRPVNENAVSQGTRDLLDAIRSAYGSVPNGLRAMARSEAVLRGAVELSSSLAETLPDPLSELIAIAIAQQNRCGYCLSAHVAAARALGVRRDEINRARTGGSVDEGFAAALAFARAVNDARGGITDDDIERVRRAGWSDADIVAIVGHVGMNVFTNYFNRVAQPAFDFPPVDVAEAA